MRIIYDAPPMYDEIDAAFAVKGRPVIFAWGDRIYMPGMAQGLSKALAAHEAVHGERQLKYPGALKRGGDDISPIRNFGWLKRFRLIVPSWLCCLPRRRARR